MDILNSKGIILKTVNIKEYDKLLIILFKDFGKKAVVARGARKQKSRFLSGSEIFVYSDFIVKSVKTFTYISQIDIIEDFSKIRYDYNLTCMGNYFLELVEKILPENLEHNESMLLLLKSLQILEKQIIPLSLIYCIFTIKLLQLNGYQPIIDKCFVCNSTSQKSFYFSYDGIICDNCTKKVSSFLKIPEILVFTLEYIIKSDSKKLFNFKLNISDTKELVKITDYFLKTHLELDLKSRKFLGNVL